MDAAIDTVDVSERATAGGWVLPVGWSVKAAISPDYDVTPEEFDCFTAKQVTAWRNDDWRYVVISVWVEDDAGREWGRDILGGTEYGHFTMTDEDDNVTDQTFIDPLANESGQYSPIREYDMIGNALREVVKELEKFGTPAIVEP